MWVKILNRLANKRWIVKWAESRRARPAYDPAQEAMRLLSSPLTEDIFQGMQDNLLGELDTIKHDGSAKSIEHQLEVCRELRIVRRYMSALVGIVESARLNQAQEESVDKADKNT